MRNKIKNKIKVISITLISFLIMFCNCTPALAAYINYNNKKVNVKEKQLLEKIKIIHNVFPKQIDEAALLATLSHRGTLTSYINDSYDPNFDKNTYRASVNSLNSAVSQANTEAKDADILLAATIIMLDSSGWIGSYSDEKYKKALAGNKLVGNMADENNILENALANGFNTLFCAGGAVADTLATPIQFGMDLSQGKADTFIQTKTSRYITMTNTCTQGYIGGTYSTVKTITDEDRKQAIKDKYAEEIIHLAELFRGKENDSCVLNPSSYGDFTNWKQYDDEWGSINLGSSQTTVKNSGCLVTAVAIQMARSGTSISNLPSGYSSFNPGALVKTLNHNGGFEGANFAWTGFETIATNWSAGATKETHISNTAELARILTDELSTGAEGQYQKFIVLQIHHNSSNQHWVAVDSVNGNEVTILDPASNGKTLDENYDGWVVDSYRVMHATDVLLGATGSSTSSDNVCSGTLDDLMDFINSFEGGTTCNGGSGYTTSTLPNDPGGLTASNGVTLGTAKGYAEQAGYSPSDIESEYRSGCPNKEKMDNIKKVILQSMYDEVGNSANEKGVTLSEIEHLALTSVRYGGYGMDRAILDKIREYGSGSYEVFHCFVTLGCGFGNASYKDGLANRRAGEYEFFKTGNTKAKNIGKGYAFYQSITNKVQLEHFMNEYWPTGE